MRHLLVYLLAAAVLGLAGCEVDVDDDIVLGDQKQPVVNADTLYDEQLDITVEW